MSFFQLHFVTFVMKFNFFSPLQKPFSHTALKSGRSPRLAPGVLTSAQASHAHVVGGHHLLLDGEVVRLQRVEGRVSQDDGGVLALVLQRQQLLRADGMQRLVGLRDEAGL